MLTSVSDTRGNSSLLNSSNFGSGLGGHRERKQMLMASEFGANPKHSMVSSDIIFLYSEMEFYFYWCASQELLDELRALLRKHRHGFALITLMPGAAVPEKGWVGPPGERHFSTVPAMLGTRRPGCQLTEFPHLRV